MKNYIRTVLSLAYTRSVSYMTDLSTNIYVLLISCTAVAILSAAAYVTWIFIDGQMKQKVGDKYIKELTYTQTLIGKEYKQRVEENFTTWNHPLYKSFWGIKLLEITRKEGNLEQESKIMSGIIEINSVPQYIKNSTKIELANLILFKQRNSSKALNLINGIKQGDPIWPLAAEIELNTILVEGKFDKYSELSNKVLASAPKHLFDRVSETLYVISRLENKTGSK